MEQSKLEDFHLSLVVQPIDAILKTDPDKDSPFQLQQSKKRKSSDPLSRDRASSMPNLSEFMEESYKIENKLFQNQLVYLQAWIVKRSRYLRIWRRRWAVLTDKHLYTFKKKEVYRNPTQRINLSNCSVPQCADAILRKMNSILLKDMEKKRKFFIRATDPYQKRRILGCLRFMVVLNSAQQDVYCLNQI